MYIVQEDTTSSCASGGIDLHGRHLIEGRLFVVVKELWEDISGFEVWEIKVKEADVKEGVLSEEVMLSKVSGRKWVHERSLISSGGRGLIAPVDLPDKPGGSALKLAPASERRFAPRQGRKGNFDDVEPSLYGDVWLEIVGESLEKYEDSEYKCQRVTFVFTKQKEYVSKAYQILEGAEEEEEEED